MITAALSGQQPLGSLTTCLDAPLSCHNTTTVDTCCLSYPGGQFVQTQFWDAHPAVGPPDSWTIHGLWPDLCDGGYEAFCDRSRAYDNITAILAERRETQLLSDMGRYWKAFQGSDEWLWSHEWAKHGTCISTLDTRCYNSYSPQQEVVDYFNVTVGLFRSLPTYQALAAGGVVPSSSRTWTAEEIQAPLEQLHGGTVALRCHGKVLNEVWYYFSVLGPVQHGEFIAAETSGMKNNCPATGTRYLPKESRGRSSTSTSPSTSLHDPPIPSPTSTPAPFTGKGFLAVRVKGQAKPHGCLISKGWWYATGTCAGFRVQDDVHYDLKVEDSSHGWEKPRVFTLTSSKGPCGIVDDRFQCAKKLPYQTVFGSTDNGTLTYHKHASFYGERVPVRYDKVGISTIDPSANEGVEVEIVWSTAANDLHVQDELHW